MLGPTVRADSRQHIWLLLTRHSFSETEAIAILAMLISRYKVEVKEEAQFAGETFAERKERILRAKRGVTLT